ncbi:hypothetical protein B0H14DRAFT_3061208 [Mycena olivaceomarginata]|nr:hypothetical protein B0H14DRAFT_3061208 [Mycena olivaceomarginata]
MPHRSPPPEAEALLLNDDSLLNGNVPNIRGTLPCATRNPLPIFRLTFPHTRNMDKGSIVMVTAPWRLALVCRRWRYCALGDGRLWSSIHVDATIPPDSADAIPHYYPLPALETQLQRSANSPLDVQFEWRGSANTNPHLLALLEVVVHHCNRWEWLTLNKIIWDVAAPDMRRVLSGIRGRLSLLRRLEISCSGPDSSGIGDIFAAAPQLQQVLLMDAGRLSLPWPQLTHFRGRFSANEYLEILRKAHNLIDCGIDLVDDELPPATPVAVLPHLRRVFAWGTRFFQFLEAPNLEYLRVNGEVLAILPLFLHRSGCQLKRLTLRHCVISLPSLISLLRHTPALSHFEVHFGYHEDEHTWVFCALKVSGIATDLCPHLTSLWIICDFNPTAEEYDSLCEMVKSRWNVGRWLKSSVPRSVLDRFEALRGDGLNGHKLIDN